MQVTTLYEFQWPERPCCRNTRLKESHMKTLSFNGLNGRAVATMNTETINKMHKVSMA